MADEIIGLDIGTNSFKLVVLRQTGQESAFVAHAFTANPIGRMLPRTPEERVRLVTALMSLIHGVKNRPKRVRVGLPESMVYTRVIQIPFLTESELASAIRWEAEQHIPVPLSEVQLDYTILSVPPKSSRHGEMTILLVAAKRTAISDILNVIEPLGLEITALDTGLLSAVRAVIGPGDPPTLLLHMGASSSDIAVVSAGHVTLTHSVPTAGIALTRAIEFELSLSVAQAEQYKQTYGLNEKLLDGRVRKSLIGTFRVIVDGVRQTLNSFESAHRGEKIQRIILSGGTALLPGASKELATSAGVAEVIIATPFHGIALSEGVTVPRDGAIYTVAVGLARGG